MAGKKTYRTVFWKKLSSYFTLKRMTTTTYSALTLSLAFVICGILILVQGVNPLFAYYNMLLGAFGRVSGIAETLVNMTPLLLASLAVAVCFKAQFINIGVEGQFFIGALFATLTALTIGSLPSIVCIPLMILAGFVGGGLWALIPGLLKVRFKANEAIVTMMMNSIAYLFISYLLFGPLTEQIYPQSPLFSDSARLPRLLSGTRLNAGILISLLSAVLLYIILSKTVLGYRMRVVHSENAAEYGGISVVRNTIYAVLIGGGLAGIAGFCVVAGTFFRLRLDISPGYGYTAIAVAFLGGLNPLLIIPSSFFFSALIVGADQMRRVTGIPVPIVTILQGLVMILVLVIALLRERRQ